MGKRTFWGDSCLRYYRKMIAAKMVFVRFFGEGESTGAAAPPKLPVATDMRRTNSVLDKV